MCTCHAGACICAVPALGVSAAALCICTKAEGDFLTMNYMTYAHHVEELTCMLLDPLDSQRRAFPAAAHRHAGKA